MNSLSIQYERKKVKYISLKMKRDGRMVVTFPMEMAMATAKRWVETKESWIKEKMASRKASYGSYYAYHQERQVIPLWGNWVPAPWQKGTKEWSEKDARLWYRHQLEQIIGARISYWENVLGINGIRWQLRWMVSRWGSCMPSKKKITLHIGLAMFPMPCLDYVIVHELAHIEIPRHDRLFYAKIKQVMTDWQYWQTVLKQDKPAE